MIEKVRYKHTISGHVQGVGFRYFVYQKAISLGIVGYTRNMYDGTVEVVSESDTPVAETFLDYLKQGPARSRVDSVKRYDEPNNEPFTDFSVR